MVTQYLFLQLCLVNLRTRHASRTADCSYPSEMDLPSIFERDKIVQGAKSPKKCAFKCFLTFLIYFQALIFQIGLEKSLFGLCDCPKTPRSGSATFCLFMLTLSIKSSALCHNCVTELDLLTCSLPRCVASDGIKVQNKCCHRLSLRVSSFPLLRS